MVRHIVLIKFLPSLDEAVIDDIFAQLHAIGPHVAGTLSITTGHSESPEQIERGYMHGFVIDFADWSALAAYQAHPLHTALGARLVANAVGGLDGILVFDMPVDAALAT